MTSIVLNKESSKTSIGDLLANATGPRVEIRNEDGCVIAELVLHPTETSNITETPVEWAESQMDELQRRRRSDRRNDITTAELLERARQAAAEQAP